MTKININEKIKNIIGFLILFLYLGIILYAAIDIESLLIKTIVIISMGIPMLKYISN